MTLEIYSLDDDDDDDDDADDADDDDDDDDIGDGSILKTHKPSAFQVSLHFVGVGT